MYETETEKDGPTVVVGVASALLLRKAREELLAIARAATEAGNDQWRADADAGRRTIGFDRPTPLGWGGVAALAEAAESAIFDFLNHAKHVGHQDAVDTDVTYPGAES